LADGWEYRDAPKMTPENWSKLLELIGEGNYRLLSFAQYDEPEGTTQRGQMMVSPKGLENLRAYTKSRAQ
jgi:hypothetical protein